MMSFSTKILLIVICISYIISIKTNQIQNMSNRVLIGVSDNTKNDGEIIAQTSNSIKSEPKIIDPTLKTVEYVDSIVPDLEKKIVNTVEVAEEIPTIIDYYNGDIKLNKIDINCKLFMNPTDCTNSSHCGWCSGTGMCIGGTAQGPFGKCLKGQFIFSGPVPHSFEPTITVQASTAPVQTNTVILP